MRAAAIALFLLTASLASAQQPETGLVITKTARLKGGTYLVPSDSDDPWQAAITVRGDDLTLDLKGVTLRGTSEETPPDERKGTAILVEGKNVTIKNARIHGYKVAILARSSPGLKILDCDLSYNWKQKLKSTFERENEDDWMSYHHNEKDEWLRYGGAIYLKDCDNALIKGNKATGGQCALMMTSCDRVTAFNNTFNYLSGIGVGLYRSSDNKVMHNALDYCVRGYAHGVYNRGQDSAGLLIYEQSHRNTIAFNSATHGGDGFFLWAGQTTMDTGQGGCNDNVVYGNDFSHAPANGIEATFSRNVFAHNLLMENWHGVWGGYSYDTAIVGNHFIANEEGIAIEHGQNNRIAGNWFVRDKAAIRIWQNKTQDPNWGYPKNRDTKSRDYVIDSNLFSRNQNAAEITDTSTVLLSANWFQFVDKVVTLVGDTPGFKTADNKLVFSRPSSLAGLEAESGKVELRSPPIWDPYAKAPSVMEEVAKHRPEPIKGSKSAFLADEANRGRSTIIVDEWGPYDYRFPKVWPVLPMQPFEGDAKEVRRFQVLGPPGTYKVITPEGASVEPREGDVPGEIKVTMPKGRAGDLELQLEYKGEPVTDSYGRTTKAGATVPFGFKWFFAPTEWNLKMFQWTDKTDPRTSPEAFAKLIAGKPIFETIAERLDLRSTRNFFRRVDPKLPIDRFATIATGSIEADKGEYEIEIETDDGCRVYLDGKRIIDSWKFQTPTTYKAKVALNGKHNLKVEHFEIDGYAVLRLIIRKA